MASTAPAVAGTEDKTCDCDLAVIGAGAAGLAAAKTARALGLSVRLLEAKDRIGGRALTDRDSLGLTWDRGAHWLHQARENPFTAVADARGFAYRTDPLDVRIWMGERWATSEEDGAREAAQARADRAFEALARSGGDPAIGEGLDEAGWWAPAYRQLLRNLNGDDPDLTSAVDWARYRETGDNWPIADGYGALVAAWAADLPVALACPVRRIAVEPGRVRLDTARGALRARTAVVTVSTEVLAAGTIGFDPALPAPLQADLESVPLGPANKVALAFDRDVFGLTHTAVSDAVRAPRGYNLLVRPFGREMVLGHCGGPLGRELEAAGPDAMVELALEQLTQMFGAAVRRHVTATASTAWCGDPWIRGGYSVCRPGHADARPRLSQPVHDRVLLAGEACAPARFGTVNGAHDSGADAARRIAGWLRRGPAERRPDPLTAAGSPPT
jgi:monoamine oxidase